MGEEVPGRSDAKVKAGFFSFTEITSPTAHRSYNEWHQLDHMPEQFPLPGIVYGQRWVSTPACRSARAVSGERLDRVHYMTLYLMAGPLEQTVAEFRALGQHLRKVNRFHLERTSHLSGAFDVLVAAAAPRVLVSAEAVPYRPTRGVYVIVEEPLSEHATTEVTAAPAGAAVSELLEMDGVAGVWVFGGVAAQRITVCFLDGDVADVAARMRSGPVGEHGETDGYRPILAGPFETITPWQWDWFDSDATAGATS